MKPFTYPTVALAAVFGWACAPVIPDELLRARAEYQRASVGPAAEVAPAELHKAQAALDQAEQAFRDDPDGPRTRDLAYVAERKAEMARVLADQALAEKRRSEATDAYRVEQTRAQQSTRAELVQTRAELAESRRDADEMKRKSTEAEQRSQELSDRLAQLAAKEEERGTVITLSGSVLFASNQTRLLPSAEKRLDEVAEALRDAPDRNVLVEGHTDGRGTDAYNEALSQARADAVRAYLVDRGVAAERIRSAGMGKRAPAADNATAEGRANNRRVEIVIERLSAKR
jgi:outer membrane protein OmpA-like peptidoglycan-associated protein